MNLSLEGFDYKDYWSWPPGLHYFFMVAVAIAILTLGGWKIIVPKQQELLEQTKLETELKQTFTWQSAEAKTLPQHKENMIKLERTLAILLAQLPNETEMADLLEDITHTGQRRGLKFTKFQPQNLIQMEIYQKVPIFLSILGTFGQFTHFISDLTSLSRIITIDSFEIKSEGVGGDSDQLLNINLSISTYQYKDDVEGDL